MRALGSVNVDSFIGLKIVFLKNTLNFIAQICRSMCACVYQKF